MGIADGFAARPPSQSRMRKKIWRSNCSNSSRRPKSAKDFEDRLRAGGLGYGDLKKGVV